MLKITASIGMVFAAILEECIVVIAVLREKGMARFARALSFSMATVSVAYLAIYAPSFARLHTIQTQLEEAKVLTQYQEEYKKLNQELTADYTRLPQASDREQWLARTILDSIRAVGLRVESVPPPQESESANLIVQSVTVSAVLKFSQLVAWLRYLENAKLFLRVSSIELNKNSERVGFNQVTCVIETIIPKLRRTP